jgi:hypothetical protein
MASGNMVVNSGPFEHSAGIIEAAAGGGQANATPLTGLVNAVITVTTAADSVLLPSAVPGAMVMVWNQTANSMQVFGQSSNMANSPTSTGDTIMPANSSTPAATGTGVAQAGHAPAIYVCAVVGVWKQFLCVS